MPYGKPVVYLSTTPVSKKNEWMFVTYPTVAIVGIKNYKLENYFDDESFQFKQKSNITFIAHELGHYYLGTTFVPNSSLRWFFLEGLTDYISIQAARELLGTEVYQKILRNYTAEIESLEPTPLSQITVASEIGETYRYRYTPLLLTAIEREIGESRMWEWIRVVINSEPQITDMQFFKSTLLKAGVKQVEYVHILETYIDHPKAKENIVAKVNEG